MSTDTHAVRQHIEAMVWRLFGSANPPFFDNKELAPALLDEFVRSEHVFLAAKEFARTLQALWSVQYGTPALQLALPVSEADAPKAPVAPDLAPALPAAAVIDPSARPGTTPSGQHRPHAPLAPAASFQMPNAKSGQAYAGRIERRGGAATQYRNLRAPAGLALAFAVTDGADGAVTGTPVASGDHELAFDWSEDGVAWHPGTGMLIVNPDPRSLWQVNEPDPALPYRKPHLDAALIAADGFRIAAASRRGRSHEHAGSFRDDDFFIHHDAASGWSVMIVADGAGSATHSRQGAKLASATAGATLVAGLAGDAGAALDRALAQWDSDQGAAVKLLGDHFRALFHDAGSRAVQAIEDEALAQQAQARDYATTLLAAAARKHGAHTFVASFWIGDGAIAAYGLRGKVRLMGTPDSGEYAGQTRFLDRAALSDAGFANRVGLGRYADLVSVCLLTDGVSDPRFETDNALADGAKWDALWDELGPCLQAPDPHQQLLAWLGFFTPGHHDDRTIALLW